MKERKKKEKEIFSSYHFIENFYRGKTYRRKFHSPALSTPTALRNLLTTASLTSLNKCLPVFCSAENPERNLGSCCVCVPACIFAESLAHNFSEIDSDIVAAPGNVDAVFSDPKDDGCGDSFKAQKVICSLRESISIPYVPYI